MSSYAQFDYKWQNKEALISCVIVKTPTMLYNSNLQFFGRCLHSSVSISSIIFNLEHLLRKSCLISLTIIIFQKFASSCQNSCQNLPHMILTPVYMKKNLAKHISNVNNDLFNTLGAKSKKNRTEK